MEIVFRKMAKSNPFDIVGYNYVIIVKLYPQKVYLEKYRNIFEVVHVYVNTVFKWISIIKQLYKILLD